MNRLQTALLLALSGTLLACSGVTDQSAGIESAPRWNILLVFADDWGRFARHYAAVDGRPVPMTCLRHPIWIASRPRNSTISAWTRIN